MHKSRMKGAWTQGSIIKDFGVDAYQFKGVVFGVHQRGWSASEHKQTNN